MAKRSKEGPAGSRSSASAARKNGRPSEDELARLAAAAECELPELTPEIQVRLGGDPDLDPALAAFLDSESVKSARAIPGGQFIFDRAEGDAKPVWGSGAEVLWAPGEALMICARQGVGKSTIMQQLALARIGIREPVLFDLPVEVLPPDRQVLYLAMDRPRQIRRSFRRMVRPEDRKALNERLVIWSGPMPHLDIVNDPYSLANWSKTNRTK